MFPKIALIFCIPRAIVDVPIETFHFQLLSFFETKLVSFHYSRNSVKKEVVNQPLHLDEEKLQTCPQAALRNGQKPQRNTHHSKERGRQVQGGINSLI